MSIKVAKITMKSLWNDQKGLQQHQLPLMMIADEEAEDDEDDNEDQSDQTLDGPTKLKSLLISSLLPSSSQTITTKPNYPMAIFLSCLMTFLLSLFIVSLTLLWMLNQYQSAESTFNQHQATTNDVGHRQMLMLNWHENQGSAQIIRSSAKINISAKSNQKLLDSQLLHLLRRNSSIHLKSGSSLSQTMRGQFPENILLDLNRFEFISNSDNCERLHKRDNQNNADLNLVIVVHSAVEHFHRRQILRQTWTQISHLKLNPKSNFRANIAYAFMLGQSSVSGPQQLRIRQESQQYGDIVQGNFQDAYRNLTYKHLMTLRWSVEYCPNAQFILKLDDDAYLDIYAVIISLFNFRKYHPHSMMRNLLACSLFPNNTEPKRQGKWSLSLEQYPQDHFPSYCSGVGYLITPDVAFDLFEAVNQPEVLKRIPLIPIDDVYVTGLVAETLENLRPMPLNSLYVYDVKKLRKWLMTDDHEAVCPNQYWIGDIGSEPDWPTLSLQLWNQTKQAWKNVLVKQMDDCKLNHVIKSLI